MITPKQTLWVRIDFHLVRTIEWVAFLWVRMKFYLFHFSLPEMFMDLDVSISFRNLNALLQENFVHIIVIIRHRKLSLRHLCEESVFNLTILGRSELVG
jgi:hypothetical protein